MTYKLYEHFNTGDNSHISSAGDIRLCQTFTPQVSHTIVRLRLKVFRSVVTDDLLVRLYGTDVDGKPSGALIPIIWMAKELVTTDVAGAWLIIPVTGCDVEAGTRYAIVVWELTPVTMYWRRKAAGDGYPRGSMGKSLDNGITWTMDGDNVGGFMFEEYGEVAGYKGNILIDQVIYQHAERVVR